jgi:hypothetical protein
MASDEAASKLEAEGQRATEMLRGKVVSVVRRHRPGQLMIEFTDHTRIFVDQTAVGVEISITGPEGAGHDS